MGDRQFIWMTEPGMKRIWLQLNAVTGHSPRVTMGRVLLSSSGRARRYAEGKPRVWTTWCLLALLCVPSRLPLNAAEIEARDASKPAGEMSVGEKLARQICVSCHLFPEPQVLDRKTWQEQVLPRMEAFLGVTPPDYSSSPEGELIRQLHIYPSNAAMGKEDFEKIVDYYLGAAPERALPQAGRPEIKVGLKQFTALAGRFRYEPPATTLVTMSSHHNRIFLGDDSARAIAVLDAEGRSVASLPVGNPPVALVETEHGVYVTAIGSVVPSEIPRGELLFFERKENKFGPRKVLLKDLPRPVQSEFGDFNRDGKLDVAICLFGNHRGRFSWFENLGNDTYTEHPLVELPGAVRCATHDFNEDGVPDLGMLMAQRTESFCIFTNDGKGDFGSELVIQRQPAFGHNYFELADFNGDGRQDLLVANGDNGEYQSAMKKYHGLRLYLNRGGTRYEEAWFFPLNGATKAMARDFDGDGDLDIAAIAFYPDYEKSPRESFVYLDNQGGLKFVPWTFSQCISGRWLVMDAGDVDGDGDLDIVLGSYIRGPTSVPDFLIKTWEKQGPSLMILKNNRR
jgi:hypothetical protein